MRLTTVVYCVAALLSGNSMAAAKGQSAYDGVWSLNFVTQRGTCDPTYNFDVNISNGIVSHPNLMKLSGRVTASGLVHASVTVQDKHAAGSGRLMKSYGRGNWKGQTANAQCSGYWTAQRL
jgi:hypothetical protein